jgi:hypothetical protein
MQTCFREYGAKKPIERVEEAKGTEKSRHA